MSIPLRDELITPLIKAMEENLCGHFTFDRSQLPNAHVIDSPELLLIDSGFRSDTFNIIARANLPVDSAQSYIRDSINYFRAKGRDFAWWVGPLSRPLDIEAHLVACGLKKAEHEYGMAMPLANLSPQPEKVDGLQIKRVVTKQDLTDFAETISANWEPLDADVLPVCLSIETLLQPVDCPMRLFVGYLNEEPVATSEIFLGGGVGGLYSVATKQAFRKRGIGAIMSWEALNEMRKEKMEYAILQASAEGKNVYARLGFVEQCSYAVYK